MANKKLELRMYGFTMYNLSEIQKGIQFGHSVVEYGLKYFKDKDYQDWAKNYKTFVILDGGTSNAGDRYDQGSMEDIYDALVGQNIKFAKFKEPDLNSSLSGICLLADERVFNRKDYPDFIEYMQARDLEERGITWESSEYIAAKMKSLEELSSLYPKRYKSWLKLIGGEKNLFLRNYLKPFRLA